MAGAVSQIMPALIETTGPLMYPTSSGARKPASAGRGSKQGYTAKRKTAALAARPSYETSLRGLPEPDSPVLLKNGGF